MAIDIQGLQHEASEWIAERRRAFAEQGIAEYLGFASELVDDDARMAKGEPSAIPAAARSFVESHRIPEERVRRLKDPSYRSEQAAKAQMQLMQRNAARARAEALLSEMTNVDKLERLLKGGA
jgi:hypothetical protein